MSLMVSGTGMETGTRSTTSPRSVAQGRLFGTRDFKLRCFAGVSAAGARSRNPEAQRGISKLTWCPGTESNRHVPFGTRDFKSRASASFATRACLILRGFGTAVSSSNEIRQLFARTHRDIAVLAVGNVGGILVAAGIADDHAVARLREQRVHAERRWAERRRRLAFPQQGKTQADRVNLALQATAI